MPLFGSCSLGVALVNWVNNKVFWCLGPTSFLIKLNVTHSLISLSIGRPKTSKEPFIGTKSPLGVTWPPFFHSPQRFMRINGNVDS